MPLHDATTLLAKGENVGIRMVYHLPLEQTPALWNFRVAAPNSRVAVGNFAKRTGGIDAVR